MKSLTLNRTIPLFSLILPTIHRVHELEVFLNSIHNQKGFPLAKVEVIIVDQNPDDRLVDILKAQNPLLSITHLKIIPKGLSNARNVGIKTARGAIVAFPDDDCTYGPDTLARVENCFEKIEGKSCLFARCLDPETQEEFLNYPKEPQVISDYKDPGVFWGISIGQFYSREAVQKVGFFDEDFGIGGKWGSGEETDYALRVLKAGYSFVFQPDILVFHKKVNPLVGDGMSLEKVKSYAIGFGALCKKHDMKTLLGWKVLKQGLGAFYYFFTMDFSRGRKCWATALGRFEGFMDYSKSKNGKES